MHIVLIYNLIDSHLQLTSAPSLIWVQQSPRHSLHVISGCHVLKFSYGSTLNFVASLPYVYDSVKYDTNRAPAVHITAVGPIFMVACKENLVSVLERSTGRIMYNTMPLLECSAMQTIPGKPFDVVKPEFEGSIIDIKYVPDIRRVLIAVDDGYVLITHPYAEWTKTDDGSEPPSLVDTYSTNKSSGLINKLTTRTGHTLVLHPSPGMIKKTDIHMMSTCTVGTSRDLLHKRHVVHCIIVPPTVSQSHNPLPEYRAARRRSISMAAPNYKTKTTSYSLPCVLLDDLFLTKNGTVAMKPIVPAKVDAALVDTDSASDVLPDLEILPILYIGYSDGSICSWCMHCGLPIRTMNVQSCVLSIYHEPKCHVFVVVTADGCITLYDEACWTVLVSVRTSQKLLKCVTINQYLMMMTAEGELLMYKVDYDGLAPTMSLRDGAYICDGVSFESRKSYVKMVRIELLNCNYDRWDHAWLIMTLSYILSDVMKSYSACHVIGQYVYGYLGVIALLIKRYCLLMLKLPTITTIAYTCVMKQFTFRKTLI